MKKFGSLFLWMFRGFLAFIGLPTNTPQEARDLKEELNQKH